MKIKQTFTLLLTLIMIAVMAGVTPAGASPALQQRFSAGATQTYIVLYKLQSVSSDAAKVITNAGGTLVYSYNQIGVVIARSNNTYFRSNLLLDKRVDGASATTNFSSQLNGKLEADDIGIVRACNDN